MSRTAHAVIGSVAVAVIALFLWFALVVLDRLPPDPRPTATETPTEAPTAPPVATETPTATEAPTALPVAAETPTVHVVLPTVTPKKPDPPQSPLALPMPPMISPLPTPQGAIFLPAVTTD